MSMNEINPYSQRFRDLSNSELLEALDRPDDYQPLAVEAARLELDRRNLTEQELLDARSIIQAQNDQKATKQQQAENRKDLAATTASSVTRGLLVLRDGPSTPAREINFISLVLGIAAIYDIYKQAGYISFLLRESGAIRIADYLPIVPAVVLPISVYLFWRQRRIGWMALCTYLTYSACTVISTAILVRVWDYQSGLGGLMVQPPEVLALQLLFLGGMIVAICRGKIREIFGIDPNIMAATIGGGMLVASIQWLLV